MKTESNPTKDCCVSCTVTPDAVKMIDHFAGQRDLYRSNWLREAINEKLEREIKAEHGRKRKAMTA